MSSVLGAPHCSSSRTDGLSNAHARPARGRRVRHLIAWLCLSWVPLASSSCSQELVAFKAGTGGASCIGRICNTSDSKYQSPCCEGTRCGYNGNCIPVDAGGCSVFGQACANDYSCCGALPCEPVAQNLSRACVSSSCQRVGDACHNSSECCSYSCENGLCTQGRPCGVRNDKCNVPEDCCSKVCSNGNCDTSPGCAVVGDSCNSPQDCCSGYCTSFLNGSRCMSYGCGRKGESCFDSWQCCSNSCLDSKCTQNCTVLGAICTDPTDCCSNAACRADPSGQGPKSCCSTAGQLCTVDRNCCSYQCRDDGTGQSRCD